MFGCVSAAVDKFDLVAVVAGREEEEEEGLRTVLRRAMTTLLLLVDEDDEEEVVVAVVVDVTADDDDEDEDDGGRDRLADVPFAFSSSPVPPIVFDRSMEDEGRLATSASVGAAAWKEMKLPPLRLIEEAEVADVAEPPEPEEESEQEESRRSGGGGREFGPAKFEIAAAGTPLLLMAASTPPTGAAGGMTNGVGRGQPAPVLAAAWAEAEAEPPLLDWPLRRAASLTSAEAGLLFRLLLVAAVLGRKAIDCTRLPLPAAVDSWAPAVLVVRVCCCCCCR